MADEALRTCDDCVRGIEDGGEDTPIETRLWMDWHGKGSRALALMSIGASEPAMDAFRAAYAVFKPLQEMAMGELSRLCWAALPSDCRYNRQRRVDALMHSSSFSQPRCLLPTGLTCCLKPVLFDARSCYRLHPPATEAMPVGVSTDTSENLFHRVGCAPGVGQRQGANWPTAPPTGITPSIYRLLTCGLPVKRTFANFGRSKTYRPPRCSPLSADRPTKPDHSSIRTRRRSNRSVRR